MKFFLVDVKSIASAISYDQFDKVEVEKLADSILECEGLLKPLVLKPTGPETYIVLEGDREYYAAVRAREKNPRKGEMVNAFVISPEAEEKIVRQLHMLQNQAEISSSGCQSKADEKTDEREIAPVEKIPENINRKMEGLASLLSLPDQLKEHLTGMMQQMEQIFQKKTERFESLLSLPNQMADLLTGMQQQIERNFEEKMELRFRQMTDSQAQELTKTPKNPVFVNKSSMPETGYGNMNRKQLDALAKERKIKGRSKMNKEQIIASLEAYDRVNVESA